MTSAQKPAESITPKRWPMQQLPGLSQDECQRLATQGIHTTLELLQHTSNPDRRTALASQLQVNSHHIQKWIALADLSSVPSVGCQYCGLLLHAGVGSVAQLAQTPLAKIHQHILKLYVAMMQRQDLCPSVADMATWTAQAQTLMAQRSKGRSRTAPTNPITRTAPTQSNT